MLGHKDKIVVYLANERVGKQFLKDAEEEGFRFGAIKPTEQTWSDIIAVHKNKGLGFMGFIGHIQFYQSNDDRIVRVDYERCKSGERNYFYRKYNR